MIRRHFLGTTVGALAIGQAAAAHAEPLRHAARPKPPYRVWFQPRCFHRDMSLYRHMTMDASGWLDPALCDVAGITGLRWVYGTNHPDAEEDSYWRQECSIATRTIPGRSGSFLCPGVAIDEWVPPRRPDMEALVARGLRAAKQADPSLFICVWYTDLRPALVELMHDGTVDLAIIEGYTHTAERFGPEAWLAWSTCLRRCEEAAKADILDKTIFCFGHVTDERNGKNELLDPRWLDEKLHDVKAGYPTMPGIAFYQSDSADTPELRELIRHCDRLSGQLWT